MSYLYSNTPNYLARILSANMNTTADQAMTVRLPAGFTRYVVRKATVINASTSLTLAVGGVYTATSKGGSAIVAASQVYSGLTGSTKSLDLTMAAVASTDIRNEATLYLALTTGQGGAATADVYLFGDVFP